MRRMMSARIHGVAVPPPVHPVGRQPEPEAREPVHPLVAADRPAALEQHDELRRPRVEARDEFLAKPRDDRRLPIVIEVEVVEEARRLDGMEPQQRVAVFKAAFGDDLERLEADWLKFMRTVK